MACLGCDAPGISLCRDCAPAPQRARRVHAFGIDVIAAGEYDGVLRDAIVAMKRGERAYLDALAPLLVPHCPPGASIVPLPTLLARARERGFDQSVELARRVGAELGRPPALVLRKAGAAQRGRDRDARLNAQITFSLQPRIALPKEAVLLDDVCTTGATISAAAGTLGAAGVTVRGAVVLAWTPPGRETLTGDSRSILT